MKKGVDAAKWQGRIEWDRVREAGVEFAILKIISQSGKTEEAFERNFAGAQTQELPIGVYNYSYAVTVEKAKADAGKVLKVLNGRKLQCGVWLDVEDSIQKELGRQLIDLINAYKAVIEGAAYEFGVYTGLSFYNSYIRPYAEQLDCPFWIARYPTSRVMNIGSSPAESKKPLILHRLWGWQFSSNGNVPGIRGSVDLNIMYGETGEGMEESSTKTADGNPYAEPTYNLYRNRTGMRAEYVRWMQYELDRMGYGLEIDGIWGKATEAALRAAQVRLGIAADGICGPETRAQIKRFVTEA